MNELVITLCQGALGGLTFGIAHAYFTNQRMEKFNKEHEIRFQKMEAEMEERRKKFMK